MAFRFKRYWADDGAEPPLRARMGIFKWPKGFLTIGPYRKEPKNFVKEQEIEKNELQTVSE